MDCEAKVVMCSVLPMDVVELINDEIIKLDIATATMVTKRTALAIRRNVIKTQIYRTFPAPEVVGVTLLHPTDSSDHLKYWACSCGDVWSERHRGIVIQETHRPCDHWNRYVSHVIHLNPAAIRYDTSSRISRLVHNASQ